MRRLGDHPTDASVGQQGQREGVPGLAVAGDPSEQVSTEQLRGRILDGRWSGCDRQIFGKRAAAV